MNKMDAYSKLFSIDDSDLDKKYYVRLLSTSEEVPQEVIDYIESFEPKDDDQVESVEDEVIEIDVEDDEAVSEEPDESENVTKDDDESVVTEVEIDSDTVVVEEQDDSDGEDVEVHTPIIEVEEQIEDTADDQVGDTVEEVIDSEEVEDAIEEIDTIVILRDFYDHLKKASVYRKIRNSDNPDNLCKSVSSFCTRYLIELHSSDYDSELVRNAVSERVNVSEILRLLANYVEVGDLNSLAKSVVIIRNFLDKLDKEFNETDEVND